MKNLIQLVKILVIPMFVLSLTRIIFFIWNYDQFQNSNLLPFFAGLHFDISTTCMIFSPFVLFYFITNKLASLEWLENSLFTIGIGVIAFLNLIDTAFIQYSQKRSGRELLEFLTAGDEFFNLLPSYIVDFWLLILIFIIITTTSVYFYKKLRIKTVYNHWHIFQLIIVTGAIILGIRGKLGGFSSRPLDTNDATKHLPVQYSALVLNSPFTLIKSFEKNQITQLNYFDDNKVGEIFNPVQKIPKTTPTLENQNIVILILESFSASYIGAYNNGKGFTPFLDSLIKESVFFPNFFANGTHSAEAVPSIFSSIPALIDEGLIFSEYVNTQTNSLPQYLKKRGYTSSFFHGANNGSMHFDSYTKAIGFDNYFGRTEYNNDEHFDGKWGIYDHYFYQFTIDKMGGFEQPFMSSIFSLSSHHPYNIPNQLTTKFKEGDLEIHKAIGYADWSLSEFLKRAKNTPWYNNTLFIITADHTSYTRNRKYKFIPYNYNIPLILFHPNDSVFQKRIDSTFAMHIDLFPTVVELTGGNESIISFGNSIFNEGKNDFFALKNNVYQYIQDSILIQFDGENTIGTYNFLKDLSQQNNLINTTKHKEQEKKLKAILQQFNNRLVNNKLYVE